MSEKAVIELSKEELEMLDELLGMGVSESPYVDLDDGIKLWKNIDEQARKNRSIIEWHSMDEKPDRTNVIVRLTNGIVDTDWVHHYTLSDEEKAAGCTEDWYLDTYRKDGVSAWAYLPE